MTTAATSAATIERDISCFECHYNIRGLPADTACPECGLPVGNTLLAIVDRDAVQRIDKEIDLPFLKSARDGLLLVLIGVVMWVCVLCLPYTWENFRSKQRVFVLVLCCCAWASNCFGFHKLAARSSSAIIRAADPVMRRMLRCVALFLGVVPAAITIVSDYKHPLFIAEPIERRVGSSRVDLQACKLEYSIVSPK